MTSEPDSMNSIPRSPSSADSLLFSQKAASAIEEGCGSSGVMQREEF